MPKIECLTFELADDANAAKTSMLISFCNSSTPTIVRAIEDAVRLIQTSDSNHCFLLKDLPELGVTWRQFGMAAATATIARDGRILLGLLMNAGTEVEQERTATDDLKMRLNTSLSDQQQAQIEATGRPLLCIFLWPPDADYASVLSLIFLMPVFCELCGLNS